MKLKITVHNFLVILIICINVLFNYYLLYQPVEIVEIIDLDLADFLLPAGEIDFFRFR